MEEFWENLCSPIAERLEAKKLAFHADDILVSGESDSFYACTFHTSAPSESIELMISTLRELGAPKRTVVEEICEGIGAVHPVWGKRAKQR